MIKKQSKSKLKLIFQADYVNHFQTELILNEYKIQIKAITHSNSFYSNFMATIANYPLDYLEQKAEVEQEEKKEEKEPAMVQLDKYNNQLIMGTCDEDLSYTLEFEQNYQTYYPNIALSGKLNRKKFTHNYLI